MYFHVYYLYLVTIKTFIQFSLGWLPFLVISSVCPKDRLSYILLVSVTDPEACYIGTEPWKPKEALEENGIITDKADIFAFGLTLWEMMTLSIPHINLPDDDDEGITTYFYYKPQSLHFELRLADKIIFHLSIKLKFKRGSYLI